MKSFSAPIHSKASVFLLELIINIFFFSILLVVSLRFFVEAKTTTTNTIDLENGIRWCQNLASIYQSGDGDLSIFEYYYPDAIILDDELIIYLDHDYKQVNDNPSYQIVINLKDEKTEGLSKASIRFIDNYSKNIYGINTYHYEPLTPNSIKGGGSNE